MICHPNYDVRGNSWLVRPVFFVRPTSVKNTGTLPTPTQGTMIRPYNENFAEIDVVQF